MICCKELVVEISKQSDCVSAMAVHSDTSWSRPTDADVKGACFGISPINMILGADFTTVVNNLQQLEDAVATQGCARCGFVPSGDGATKLKFSLVFFQIRPVVGLPSTSLTTDASVLLAQGLHRQLPSRCPHPVVADSFDRRQSRSQRDRGLTPPVPAANKPLASYPLLSMKGKRAAK